jgi:hypothetical protein
MLRAGLLAMSLISVSLTVEVPSASAKGPNPSPETTCIDSGDPGNPGQFTCFYNTQKDCWAGRRARHRQGVTSLSPCYLNGPLYPEYPADNWFYTYIP